MLPEIRALVPVLRGVDDDICDSTFSSVFALCEARDGRGNGRGVGTVGGWRVWCLLVWGKLMKNLFLKSLPEIVLPFTNINSVIFCI